MKRIIYLLFLLFLFPLILSAQKVKVDVKGKVTEETNYRANKNTDELIDKSFDKLEGGIKGMFRKKKKKGTGSTPGEAVSAGKTAPASSGEKATADAGKKKAQTVDVKWNNYDFVPGDKVIFEDGPSADEENGEFPSRWDLYRGTAEIAEADGKPVILFPDGSFSEGIIPYLKNAREDYLPEVFTIEFDAYFPPERYNNRYYLNFCDKKNQSLGNNSPVSFYVNSIDFMESEGTIPGKERRNWDAAGGWRHFAVAYTRGKMKIYADESRLINIPHYEANPTGITLVGAFEKAMIKNIRIAEGGVKYYDRVLSEGKIIVNGIRFDVNKATLRPESMGAINRIYRLMEKNPDLRFSVEGHTDSDGDEDFNLNLSKARAKTVMDKLIAMGIPAERLKYTGWGESKPIDTNATAEGRANNRRVEFVKF